MVSASRSSRVSESRRKADSVSSALRATRFFIAASVWNICTTGTPQLARRSSAARPESQ
jgi:hypothetical protein